MIFPELRSLLKRAGQSIGNFSENEPISLDLKSNPVVFDTVNAAWYARNGYPQIYAALSGGQPSWSGESVGLESALQCSVVWACNRIISETIGYLPASVMQQKGNAKRQATEHPMYEAMKYQPNEQISSQEFTETLTSHALLIGGGYARINRRSGTDIAFGMDLLSPNVVFPDHDKQGQLVYVIRDGVNPEKTYTIVPGKPHPIFHLRGLGWDGVRGYSVIDKGKQIIGMAIAVERNLNRFWANGGRVPYHIESDGHFENDQQFQEFRTQWEATYSQAHKAPILEDGLKLVTDGLSMHDSQANEFRQFMIPEVCRLFSVSPHLVADLSRATFSNIEHLTLEFVKMTLSQWLSRWEQSFRRCVLTPAERQAGYYLHFNVNALLRGDFKTRMDGYSIALQNGFKNIDEVRELEDDNALPNGAGETHRVQLNMQTVPGTGEPSIMEQGILARQTPAEPKSTEALVKAVVDAAGVDTTHDIMVLQHELAETLDGMKGINGPVDIHALERMIDGIPAELEYKAKRRKS